MKDIWTVPLLAIGSNIADNVGTELSETCFQFLRVRPGSGISGSCSTERFLSREGTQSYGD
jgi:hypothetical protein